MALRSAGKLGICRLSSVTGDSKPHLDGGGCCSTSALGCCGFSACISLLEMQCGEYLHSINTFGHCLKALTHFLTKLIVIFLQLIDIFSESIKLASNIDLKTLIDLLHLS